MNDKEMLDDIRKTIHDLPPAERIRTYAVVEMLRTIARTHECAPVAFALVTHEMADALRPLQH